MNNLRKRLDRDFNKRTDELYDALMRTCPDGSFALDNKTRLELMNALQNLEEKHLAALKKLEAARKDYAARKRNNLLLDTCFWGISSALKTTQGGLWLLGAQKNFKGTDDVIEAMCWVDLFQKTVWGTSKTNDLLTTKAAISGNANAFMAAYNKLFAVNGLDMKNDILKTYDDLYSELDNLMPLLYEPQTAGSNAGGGCKTPRKDNPPSPNPDVTPSSTLPASSMRRSNPTAWRASPTSRATPPSPSARCCPAPGISPYGSPIPA